MYICRNFYLSGGAPFIEKQHIPPRQKKPIADLHQWNELVVTLECEYVLQTVLGAKLYIKKKQ